MSVLVSGTHECPLCGAGSADPIGIAAGRDLFLCRVCDLVFVTPSQHLTPDRERERYSQHDNSADNAEYVRYLEGVARVLDTIPIDDPEVLDFGCGEEAVLTEILHERGVRCAAYDPLYGIGTDTLSRAYDVVIACEVIEHLRDPAAELGLIERLVRTGGYLVVRTQLRPENPEAVSRWWYAQDPTHICLFSERSLRWMAHAIHMPLQRVDLKGTAVLGPHHT
ncbi:MAG: methyltransferase domain-containing protein [Chitinivibrionales bacterium]|nr:methyltransferase domain-containing protein [Chitinivibrionales bacterium]